LASITFAFGSGFGRFDGFAGTTGWFTGELTLRLAARSLQRVDKARRFYNEALQNTKRDEQRFQKRSKSVHNFDL